MNILWLSWKDRSHPLAGGAEHISGEFMERLIADGHKVCHITAAYAGALSRERTENGIEIFRAGNRFTTYFMARKIYKNNLKDWPSLVIDEMNTIPYFASSYIKDVKSILLAYQLARKVWFYQMMFPLSLIGYMSEPIMLRLVARLYPLTLTESESSKKDMRRHGFKQIEVFRPATKIEPLTSLSPKHSLSNILSLGSIRPMKQTLHAVKAFELARDKNQNLRLIVAGDDSGSYADKVKRYAGSSRHAKAITFTGRVTEQQKLKLMEKSSVILLTSIKEGWGLTVTEANLRGTPAVAYNVDGLRDSIQDGKTGYLCSANTPNAMAKQILHLLHDPENYYAIRSQAWVWSKQFNFDNAFSDFKNLLNLS